MSSRLNGSKHSPPGSRVPDELLATAARYERARGVIFERLGRLEEANACTRLKRYYEQKAVEADVIPGKNFPQFPGSMHYGPLESE